MKNTPEYPFFPGAKPSIKWGVQEDRTDKKAARDRKRAGKSLDQLEKSLSSIQISDKKNETSVPESLTEERLKSQKAEDANICDKLPPSTEDDLSDYLKEMKDKEFKPVQLKTNIPTTFHLANREINKPIDVLSCIMKLAHSKDPSDEEDSDEKQDDSNTNEHQYFNEKLFTTEKSLRELIAEESKLCFCRFLIFKLLYLFFSQEPPRSLYVIHRNNSTASDQFPAEGRNPF